MLVVAFELNPERRRSLWELALFQAPKIFHSKEQALWRLVTKQTVRPESPDLYTPRRDEEHSRHFHVGVPLVIVYTSQQPHEFFTKLIQCLKYLFF